MNLYILKRNGEKHQIDFSKVSSRIKSLATDPILGPALAEEVIINTVQYIITGLISGMHTRDLDLLGADYAAHSIPRHPDYGKERYLGGSRTHFKLESTNIRTRYDGQPPLVQ